ncbi:lipid-A-disaccharide synthase [Acanthopleuribacter pedis]|uniref:Lipid-A-disaccharide synthase n=1 Tax=Acanthopleuribacter pedis TaxID=442870 RepID=A0A8J7Q0T7_9BACT|nr:lipid-A-disaccharide synthase [Acanthopleuribacter pedis]MBO1317124.1 lipid-A-disaccharide synthase [Acanthopleuribacter pedis]
MASQKKLFLLTTESSGDLLGARLLAALKPNVPGLEVRGVGGEKLKAEGMHLVRAVSDFNVMGLVEVLSQLSRLRAMFAELVEDLRTWQPDVVVLIDAPDFNLRFAKALRGLGIPVVYYVSPQVWAWRKGRAKKIAKLVDHMMVLFRFETEIYHQYGLKTTWVGHPLVDEVTCDTSRAAFLAEEGLDPSRPLVALAPGSRRKEVKSLLPTMLDVAKAKGDRYQFAIPAAPTIDTGLMKQLMAEAGVQIPILPGKMRPLIRHADAAVVASGTATLETGLLGTPMIVGYRLQRLSYALAKRLVQLDNIALVNIVLGRRVVPELIQDAFNPDTIWTELEPLLEDAAHRREVEAELARLPEALGGGGAANRAAAVVKDYLI